MPTDDFDQLERVISSELAELETIQALLPSESELTSDDSTWDLRKVQSLREKLTLFQSQTFFSLPPEIQKTLENFINTLNRIEWSLVVYKNTKDSPRIPRKHTKRKLSPTEKTITEALIPLVDTENQTCEILSDWEAHFDSPKALNIFIKTDLFPVTFLFETRLKFLQFLKTNIRQEKHNFQDPSALMRTLEKRFTKILAEEEQQRLEQELSEQGH